MKIRSALIISLLSVGGFLLWKVAPMQPKDFPKTAQRSDKAIAYITATKMVSRLCGADKGDAEGIRFITEGTPESNVQTIEDVSAPHRVRYQVTGDLEMGTGSARIRKPWICRLRYGGNGAWAARYIKVGEAVLLDVKEGS